MPPALRDWHWPQQQKSNSRNFQPPETIGKSLPDLAGDLILTQMLKGETAVTAHSPSAATGRYSDQTHQNEWCGQGSCVAFSCHVARSSRLRLAAIPSALTSASPSPSSPIHSRSHGASPAYCRYALSRHHAGAGSSSSQLLSQSRKCRHVLSSSLVRETKLPPSSARVVSSGIMPDCLQSTCPERQSR